jgi:hypothetical protein
MFRNSVSVPSSTGGTPVEDGTERRLLILRRRGNNQKTIYHYYNTAKAWKPESLSFLLMGVCVQLQAPRKKLTVTTGNIVVGGKSVRLGSLPVNPLSTPPTVNFTRSMGRGTLKNIHNLHIPLESQVLQCFTDFLIIKWEKDIKKLCNMCQIKLQFVGVCMGGGGGGQGCRGISDSARQFTAISKAWTTVQVQQQNVTLISTLKH